MDLPVPVPPDIENLIDRFTTLAVDLTTPVAKAHLAESVEVLEKNAQTWKVEDLTRREFITDQPTLRLKCPNDPTIFTVSKSILLREPGSFFTTLLSSRWEASASDDVINLPLEDVGILPALFYYLEAGPSVLPREKDGGEGLLQRLGEAAKCLCIITLQDYVQYPPDQFLLPQRDLALKQRIDSIRHLFGQDRHHPLLTANPYLDLVRVFDDPSVLNPVSPVPFNGPLLLNYPDTRFDVVKTFEAFKNRFHDMHGGSFDGIDWANMVVAGGSVLMSLIVPPETPEFRRRMDPEAPPLRFSNDIDIFLCGLDPDAAFRKILSIEAFLRKRQAEMNPGGEFVVVRTHHALTFHPEGLPKVQIILRLYQSPSEVLYGFDIDCVSVLYDGTHVWALPRALRAIQWHANLFDLGRVNITFNQRIAKYARRGFALAVPGFSWERVNWQQLTREPMAIRAKRRRWGPPPPKPVPTACQFLFSELVRKTLFLLRPRPGGIGLGELQAIPALRRLHFRMLREAPPTDEPAPPANPRLASSTRVGEMMAMHAQTLYPTEGAHARIPLGMDGLDEAKFRVAHGLRTDSGYHDMIEAVSPLFILSENFKTGEPKVMHVVGDNVADVCAGKWTNYAVKRICELGGTARPAPPRRRWGWAPPPPPENKATPAKVRAYLEKAVDLPARLEWITVDLDRQFIGSFHHPIHASYFDCYLDVSMAPESRLDAGYGPLRTRDGKMVLPEWFARPGEGDAGAMEREVPPAPAAASASGKKVKAVKKVVPDEDEDDDEEEEEEVEKPARAPMAPRKVARAVAGSISAGARQACPLCAKLVHPDLLQAHVNAELDGRAFPEGDDAEEEDE